MAFCLFATKSLPEPMLVHCPLDSKENVLMTVLFENQKFLFNKMHLKMLSATWLPFCLNLNVLNPCSGLTIIYIVIFTKII